MDSNPDSHLFFHKTLYEYPPAIIHIPYSTPYVLSYTYTPFFSAFTSLPYHRLAPIFPTSLHLFSHKPTSDIFAFLSTKIKYTKVNSFIFAFISSYRSDTSAYQTIPCFRTLMYRFISKSTGDSEDSEEENESEDISGDELEIDEENDDEDEEDDWLPQFRSYPN